MEQPSSFVKAPHFTLPSDKERGPELSLAWPLHSYDVMHRWKMVHLAYTYDPELGITVAFAMDGEGQHWETTTWVEPNESRFMVRELWKFLDEFRRTCAVESRIAVCRHGEMPADELQGELYDPSQVIAILTIRRMGKAFIEQAGSIHIAHYGRRCAHGF